ncbi:replication-relaxation family protein [Streptomyces sp. SBT349]|uniref:replication-relaxation family protein n=1 Tax=Streptomyces sp. SBT349 TaxID=1580539 RepID=UPI00066DDE54|nr:replication-relaxation family protein [Streptomyces sp. SBT349]
MTGSATYPYGSTSRMRADVLCALGVLKVATASQLQRIARPGARDNKSARNALLDLSKHGLVVSDGNTQGPPGTFGRARTSAAAAVSAAGPGGHPKSQKLWRLTPAGLDAAVQLLPADHHRGGTARGAGRHGAPHSMAVNETILAFLQPAAAHAHDDVDGVMPRGLGSITAWSTEVVLPVTGSVSAPSKGSPRPDAVLRAAEAAPALPLLCVEVDTGTEPPARIAEKLESYRRFFRRTVAAPAGPFGSTRQVPYWSTLYGTADLEGHPPVALVFTGMGPRGLAGRTAAVEDLTRAHWSGRPSHHRYWDADDFHWTEYDDAIPVLATTLAELQQHGPHGPVWRRYGHRPDRETLAAALANPDGAQTLERHDTELRLHRDAAEERQRQEQEAERLRREEEEEREATRQAATVAEAARREACARCDRPRHDDRFGQDTAADDAPPPDGVHCTACRRELQPCRGPFGRLARRLGGY